MKRNKPAFFIFVLLLMPSLTAATVQQPAKPALAPIEIPFELVGRHIVLPVRVNNSRPLSFVFDTGDKFGVIDIERARELKLTLGSEVRIGGAGAGQLTGAFVQSSTWSLPGLEGFSQPISLAFPMADLAARLGHDFDGIVGSDFIKQFVIEVDYRALKLKLYDKDAFAYSGSGESIAVQFNNQGHPLIDAQVTPNGAEPVKGKFVIDLGSGGALVLHSPFVRTHKLLDSGIKTIKSISGGGAGGTINGRVGRVSELAIGKFRVSNPITLFSEDTAGAFASSQLAGNIGQQIMSKFRIFLDYSHERIILEPNETLNEPFDRSYAGLSLRSEDKLYQTFRVVDILDQSPAAEAGLRKDDVITAIDGKSGKELTLTKLTEMFEQPVTRKVTIRRGEQTLQLNVTPRKLL
jgi:hypothetical protein